MTTERCHRCDRAECPWWATPDPQSDDDLFAIGHEARDCELHAVPIERWRQRALAAEAALDAAEAEREALRASFASQAQVTVTARQAVCDVVVQRDAAVQRAEAAEARHPAPTLTVGAALALPEVQRGEAVVEYRWDTFWWRVDIDHRGIRLHRWSASAKPQWVSSASDQRKQPAVYAHPCRLVPLAEADADPASRGPL